MRHASRIKKGRSEKLLGASFRENASKSKDVAYLGGPLTLFEIGTEVTIDRKHMTKILAWYASSLLI